MVLIHRCRIRKVATFDEALARYDIETITPDVSMSAATTVEPEPG